LLTSLTVWLFEVKGALPFTSSRASAFRSFAGKISYGSALEILEN